MADSNSSNDELPFHEGQIIAGKYEVDRILGQGGMGVVVSAHHIALQQKVAIKFLLPQALAVPGAAPRFLREARSAVAIQSEHVARVLDVGAVDGGPPYMVMEYLTGSDLRNVLEQAGRLSIAQALDYVLQACEAIAEAHAIGIVHRDLKPDNIFVTRRKDGSSLVKVLDFGLSKPTKEDALGGPTPSLTATHVVAGSPQYMSPEQVRSLKSADHRTDVWALGVILYELLTGQRPFEADSLAGIFAKIAADPPLRPRALKGDLPPGLEAVILRCLEKDVSRRVQDVAELATLLEPFAQAESRTSIERIVRVLGKPAIKAPQRSADPMEAHIPTVAASPPPPPRSQPRRDPRAAAPTVAQKPAGGPVARAERPVQRRDPADFSPMTPMDIDVSTRAVHPAQRGRPLARADNGPPSQVSDLKLGGPIRVLVAAVLIGVADMVVVRMLGQSIALGPVKPLMIAGPLAGIGAIWILVKILKR
ncbi:MAG: serine/threonine protein kinase [Polyangiaceae bacterium]|nr:serine/threonine protein kinase [Polyangiaceae bacterium]